MFCEGLLFVGDNNQPKAKIPLERQIDFRFHRKFEKASTRPTVFFMFVIMYSPLELYEKIKTKTKAAWFGSRLFIIRLWYRSGKIIGSVRQNIFFDLQLILIYAIILFALLIFLYPYKSYFTIPDYATVIYIVENLSRATAIFIGIIISLIILSFQIFNTTFGRYAFVGFFNNRYIKFLFTLYVINILLSVYVLAYFKNVGGVNNYGVALFAFSLATNLLLIISILPVSVALIKGSQSRSNLQKIYGRITENWVYKFHFHRNNRIESLEIIEEDPMRMLLEIGKKFIREDDTVSLELLSNGLYNYLIQLIEKHKKDNSSVNNFAYVEYADFASELVLSAIKSGNQTQLNKLLQLRSEMEFYVLKNSLKHTPWKTEFVYESVWFEFDHENYFHVAIMEDNKELAELIIGNFVHYCEYLIKNYFPERFKEHDERKYEDYSKEKHMSYQLLSNAIRQFIEMASRHKRLDVFRKLTNTFYLDGVIIDSKNSPSVKSYLMHLLKGSKIELFNTLLDLKPTEIGSLDYPFGSIYLQQEIENLETKNLFNQMKAGMNIAYNKGYLNNMMINSLKAAGMGFIRKFKEKPFYKSLLKEVITQFDYLRSIIPAEGDNYQKNVYVKLHKYLDFVRQDFVGENITDSELSELFNTTLQAFDKLNEYKTHLSSIGYISDDRI